MSKPSRKEMKDVLRDPRTDPARRERYIVLYREAFMRDLKGLIAAWGEIRPNKVEGVLDECDNNIKLVITTLIQDIANADRDKNIPGARHPHPRPCDGDALPGYDG